MTHAHIGVVAGALSFKEIARAWSKVAGDSPEMLMDALVRDFWLGKFENDGQSVLFVLSKPASPTWAPSTWQLQASRIDPIGFVERRPGDYSVRDGGEVVKVAEDGESYPTHERDRIFIRREDVAYVLCQPEWRDVTAKHPAGFRGFTDKERDEKYPTWRREFEDRYLAFFMRSFNQWSPEMRDDHYAQWRIERTHFAVWYSTSPLSAGAPLEEFWPPQSGKGYATESTDEQAAQVGQASETGPVAKDKSQFRPEIWQAATDNFPDGIPKNFGGTRIKKHLLPYLQQTKLIPHNANPDRKTFERALKDYPRKKGKETQMP